MSKEEFIKQRCEIDKITEEEFEKRYRVVKCNCGQPYCKGYRCLDLDGLLKENQELKKQLEEAQENIILLKASKPMLEYKKALEENQQKKFIKYLENCINELKKESMNKLQNTINLGIVDITKEILSKYKKIIGSDINVGSIGGKE